MSSCMYFTSGLCDSTITELDIGIDVEILKLLLILSYYWYCNILTFVIDIDIDIAKGCYMISLLILILRKPEKKY